MIVILEDNEDRQAVMRECFSKAKPERVVLFFITAADTIHWLKSHLRETKLIALDHGVSGWR